MEYLRQQLFKYSFGLSSDLSLRFFTGFFVYFLSFVFRFLESTNLRYIFSIFFGPIIIWFMYGSSSLAILVLAVVVYLLIQWRSKYTPLLVSFVSFGMLTIFHLKAKNAHGSAHTLDITGPLMFECLKLISLSWSIYDGQKKDPKDFEFREKELMVKKIPSLVEYFSFIYYFGALSMGPIIDFKPYQDFIKGDIFKGKVPKNGKPVKKFDGMLQGLLGFFYSMFFLFAFLKLSSIYNFDLYKDPNFYIKPFWYKFWVVYILGFTYRSRYYGAFIYTEGHNKICGFSFNGYDEKGSQKWDRFNGVFLLKTEFPTCTREYLARWNYRMHTWLKSNVYYRIYRESTTKKNRFLASVGVAFITCIWHGQRACFYLSGLFSFIIDIFDRNFRKTIKSIFINRDEKLPNNLQIIGNVLCTIFFGMTLSNSISTIFSIYDFDNLIGFIKSIHYFLILYPVIGIIFLFTIAKPISKFFRNKLKLTKQEKIKSHLKKQN